MLCSRHISHKANHICIAHMLHTTATLRLQYIQIHTYTHTHIYTNIFIYNVYTVYTTYIQYACSPAHGPGCRQPQLQYCMTVKHGCMHWHCCLHPSFPVTLLPDGYAHCCGLEQMQVEGWPREMRWMGARGWVQVSSAGAGCKGGVLELIQGQDAVSVCQGVDAGTEVAVPTGGGGGCRGVEEAGPNKIILYAYVPDTGSEHLSCLKSCSCFDRLVHAGKQQTPCKLRGSV